MSRVAADDSHPHRAKKNLQLDVFRITSERHLDLSNVNAANVAGLLVYLIDYGYDRLIFHGNPEAHEIIVRYRVQVPGTFKDAGPINYHLCNDGGCECAGTWECAAEENFGGTNIGFPGWKFIEQGYLPINDNVLDPNAPVWYSFPVGPMPNPGLVHQMQFGYWYQRVEHIAILTSLPRF